MVLSSKGTATVSHFSLVIIGLPLEEYYVSVEFYASGSARIFGVLWPTFSSEFSKLLSSCSLSGDEVNFEMFLQKIHNSVLTTANKEEIKDCLNTTDEDASFLSELVTKYQVQDFTSMNNIPLPSLEMMVTLEPPTDCRRNIFASAKFLEYCRNKMNELTNNQKKTLHTIDWLQSLSRLSKFALLDEDTLEIVMEDQIHEFCIEPRLDTLMCQYGSFNGLFQYSLSCSSEQYSVVLKRSRIADCYVVPYNPVLLKAFKNKTEIQPISSESQWWDINDKYLPQPLQVDHPEITNGMHDHALIPVTEFLALSDPKRLSDIYSSPIAFISTFQKHRPKFRKVPTKTDETFQCQGMGHFIQLSSNVQRHVTRLNGKKLLLVETALWYDLIPAAESATIYNLYSEHIERIQDSNIISVYGENLPKYILSSNHQIMKVRQMRKVMTIPHFNPLSDDSKYSRIMLFYPLQPNSVVNSERLGNVVKINFGSISFYFIVCVSLDLRWNIMWDENVSNKNIFNYLGIFVFDNMYL